MKRNRFGYYIKEGVSSIFNHGFMSFASICIIIACLLIMGTFSLIALNVNKIVATLEEENQILAFVDENMSETDARAIQSDLEKVENVATATYVSKNEAKDSFTQQYDSSLFEGIDSTVFRDRYIITLDDLAKVEQTQNDLLKVDGIVKVNAHLEISEGFVTVERIVSIVSIILVGILLVVSLFIMSNTIKLTTFERREEIAIMKMVGATSSFIRWPFVIEGLALGMTGSLTAFIAQWGIYKLATVALSSGFGISLVDALQFSEVAIPLLIAFLAIGFGVGVIGSLVAIKNYLKV